MMIAKRHDLCALIMAVDIVHQILRVGYTGYYQRSACAVRRAVAELGEIQAYVRRQVQMVAHYPFLDRLHLLGTMGHHHGIGL